MGYDLYITRAKDHNDNTGQWISADEWFHLIQDDPELKLAGYNGDYFALWSGPSPSQEPWLDWWAGNIYTKNPDPPLIVKMAAIAMKLNAVVQGDDGELYANGETENASSLSIHGGGTTLSAALIKKALLRRQLRVLTPEGVFIVAYDGRGFGQESVLIDQVTVARSYGSMWFAPGFFFHIGNLPAVLNIRVSPWLSIRQFRLVVDSQVVYYEGAPSL